MKRARHFLPETALFVGTCPEGDRKGNDVGDAVCVAIGAMACSHPIVMYGSNASLCALRQMLERPLRNDDVTRLGSFAKEAHYAGLDPAALVLNLRLKVESEDTLPMALNRLEQGVGDKYVMLLTMMRPLEDGFGILFNQLCAQHLHVYPGVVAAI